MNSLPPLDIYPYKVQDDFPSREGKEKIEKPCISD